MNRAGLITAFRTLSSLPLPGRESEKMSEALPWFPVVGFSLWALIATALWLLQSLFGPWPMGWAAFAVALSLLLTRGLHLDGLADMADGFGGGRERERVLAIMKDSCVGAFGAMAITLAILAKWVAVSRLLEFQSLHELLVAGVLSRFAMVYLAVKLPYARAEEGTAAPFVEGATDLQLRDASLLTLLLLLPLAPYRFILLILGAWLFAKLLAGWFKRRIGGVTGDLLGASNEMTEIFFLFLASTSL